MLFQRIETEGLSHYSYLVGDGSEAVVVDPRRDIDIYIDIARRNEARILYILETHRNEDYLSGSVELAGITGAEIWHADGQLPYRYGQAAEEGQEWKLGSMSLRALDTPGHTPGSMSYLLRDSKGTPWLVFTGDTLFAGEVGRTDLSGSERTREMASLLYDSIFGKLLQLGDGVIVCPAHGSGSVCGSTISDRPVTTIGLERLTNSRLQHQVREEFIKTAGTELEKSPYFRKMEDLNLAGPPNLSSLAEPAALSPDTFSALATESIILDTRFDGFGAAHIPGSICIWPEGISGFAGWFLPYDRPILLVSDKHHVEKVVEYLRRIGYDRISGYLAGSVRSWNRTGRETGTIKTVTVPELCHRLDSEEDTWVLDVRSQSELDKTGSIPGAHHIHLTEIVKRSQEVPRDKSLFVFCGSGLRAMIAASLLQRNGWKNLTVVLGGFAAWNSASCPISKI